MALPHLRSSIRGRHFIPRYRTGKNRTVASPLFLTYHNAEHPRSYMPDCGQRTSIHCVALCCHIASPRKADVSFSGCDTSGMVLIHESKAAWRLLHLGPVGPKQQRSCCRLAHCIGEQMECPSNKSGQLSGIPTVFSA